MRPLTSAANDKSCKITGMKLRVLRPAGLGDLALVRRAQDQKDKERKERAYRNALDRFLLDPEYRRLYDELGTRLSTAESDADTAIAMIEEQLRLVSHDIQDMEGAAARDPDGRQVLQFADGRMVYADGSDVLAAIAERLIWPEHAPRAEDYFAAKDRRSGLELQLEEWQVYRNDVIGGIRDRYDDPDNSFEYKDALKDALNQIEDLKPTELNPKPDTAPVRGSDIAVDAFRTIPTNGQ